MKLFILLAFVALVHCKPSSQQFDFEVPEQRSKRDVCDSSYGDWSEWTTCTSDCGYCGVQTRARVCAPISGCTLVTCTGDALESQACSTSDVVCLSPQVSCCPSTYKKKVDIAAKRFYCGLA